MAENTVVLSDDELSVIQACLALSIAGVERYKELNGETSIDYHTKQAYEESKKLFDRFNREYF